MHQIEALCFRSINSHGIFKIHIDSFCCYFDLPVLSDLTLFVYIFCQQIKFGFKLEVKTCRKHLIFLSVAIESKLDNEGMEIFGDVLLESGPFTSEVQ